MRGAGVTILVLLAGCRFDLPGSQGIDDAASDGAPSDGVQGTLFRKRITIDPTRVTGDQLQFPVWIVLDGDAGLEAYATQNGSDIHFTAEGGTPVPYQIQRWTKSAGRLEAWVRADLSDTVPTVLELRYGDPARTSAPNPAQVFASSFEAVWHLDDPLDTTAVADATSKRPGSAAGLGPGDQVTAQLGGGIDFDGIDDRVLFTNPFTGGTAGSDHTFSAWVNQRTPSGCDSIVTLGNPTGNQSRIFWSSNGGHLDVGFYNNDWPTGASALPSIANTGWVLLHWVFKISTRQSRVYRNGVLIGSHTFNGGMSTQGTDGHLGYAPAGWGTCWLNGILDEVRPLHGRAHGWLDRHRAREPERAADVLRGRRRGAAALSQRRAAPRRLAPMAAAASPFRRKKRRGA